MLFLDEPTSGVDPIARGAFWRLIHDLAESGHTVFVSTHYMDEAEYCNRLALMYRGKVIALGTPAELKAGLTAHKLLRPGDRRSARDHAGARRRARHERRGGVRRRPARHGGRCRARRSPRIRRRLAAKGIELRRIAEIQPSMEDVFVALIEAEERKGAA